MHWDQTLALFLGQMFGESARLLPLLETGDDRGFTYLLIRCRSVGDRACCLLFLTIVGSKEDEKKKTEHQAGTRVPSLDLTHKWCFTGTKCSDPLCPLYLSVRTACHVLEQRALPSRAGGVRAQLTAARPAPPPPPPLGWMDGWMDETERGGELSCGASEEESEPPERCCLLL